MPLRLLPLALLAFAMSARADDLRTVAERTDYKHTAKHADVVDLCKKIAEASKGVATLSELGTSTEGRSIPLMIVADPPVKSPEEARKSGKLVALLIGNIHAGEVCGKEALPMLVREIATTPNHPLLKDFILLVAPIYNADGNEKFAKTNRPGQVGPEEMGVRHNGQDLDLNRDFVKLEAPETRGLVHLLNTWDPHLFIDVHTTNGSYHRYEITYQGPKNPAGDDKLLSFTRDVLMPEAGKLLEAKTGYKSFFYGNFDRDHTLWTTYGATPRFGTTYVGMRDRLGVLSEAYSYVDFKTRVIASLEFCRGLLETASAHKDEIKATLDSARKARPATIPIRSEARVAKMPVKVLGYVEEAVNGRPHSTGEPKDYTVGFEQDFAGTESVTRPFAYVIPPRYQKAIETIKRHGIAVEELPASVTTDSEGYAVDEIIRANRRFEKHATIDVKVTPRRATRTLEAGSAIVKTDQPLGTLAVCFLEPRSDDGLVTWNFFDEGLKAGDEFPVVRLLSRLPGIPGCGRRRRRRSRSTSGSSGGGGGRRGARWRWPDGAGLTARTGSRGRAAQSSRSTLRRATRRRSSMPMR